MSAIRTDSGHVLTPVLQWLGPPLAILFILAVPLCLVSNNVRWVALDPGTYRQGFAKYQASARTGLDPDELERVARAFITYFQSPPGVLNPTVRIGGRERPLFNEREVAHMADVQGLMRLVFRVGTWSGLYLLVVAGAILLIEQRGGFVTLGRLLLGGCALTLVLLAAVAALSFVDFSSLFVRFHQLSFRNDLWMLDPRSDYLLMLFPEGFWFDVTLRIAALTAGEAAVLGALGWFLSRS